MPDVSTHPSAKALALFGHGKLPAAQAATVAAHLETCADCCQAVAALAPDSFMGKVRDAQPRDGSVPPAPAPSRLGASPSLMGQAAAPAAPPADVPPELANHPKFRIVRELGRGGMGKVYEAVQTFMDRRVAIKVMNPALLDNPDALARFHTEVRAAARLDHPNIVRAHDAEPAGSLHLLVMELVEGLTLAQLVERKGPLPIASACLCVQQAARGLQHAFEQGMVHRDIKPQNLMLTPQLRVKVLDFGLARMRSERARGPGLTQLDAFMGTPEYVAPEQATDARSADTRADIYSLGCTLYFLLTGRPPFVRRSLAELAMAHLYEEPAPLREVRPDVPAALSAVVGRMLAKDPAQRYQTPVEVAQVLAPFTKAGGQAGIAVAAPLPPPVRAAGRGTVVGNDTSRLEKAGQKASPFPTKGTAAANDKAAPFAGLGDAPQKPADRGREAVKRARAKWWKRTGVLALATVGALMLLAGVIIVVVTSDGAVILLEVDQPGAEVLVDGKKIEVAWDKDGKKAKIDVKPGTRKVEARKDGFESDPRVIKLEAGESKPITILFKPKNAVPDEGAQSVPVAKAIEDGVKWLRAQQLPDGTWRFSQIGLTALCGLTLLECDVPSDDPVIRKAAKAIRDAAVAMDRTYDLALSILFLDRLGQPVDVDGITLLTKRLLKGRSDGGWRYHCPRIAEEGMSDNSNTQFAVLGLWAARRHGLGVDDALQECEKHFRQTQRDDGGWGYSTAEPDSTPSMTCAGLLGVAAGYGARNGAAPPGDGKDKGPGRAGGARPRDVDKALHLLGRWIDANAKAGQAPQVKVADGVGWEWIQPGPGGERAPQLSPANGKFYYFLWALERVAVAYDLEKFGRTNWYDWGAGILLRNQQGDGSWSNGWQWRGPPDTCFALLFLRRANLTWDLTRLLKPL
jgi:hypothetical protein